MPSIRDNLEKVRRNILQAAAAAGRDPAEIQLIAVCKTFPPEYVMEAVSWGQVHFGENRVQEAAAKIPEVICHQPLQWHLVGHLQSNKARRAAALFDWVHSVDSLALLRRLDEGAQAAGKILPVLIQVDLAREPTKSGLDECDMEALLAAAGELKNVSVRGLMVLPPFFEDPEMARPYFRKLREMRDALAARSFPAVELRELSMGMSHDFVVAIQEGATMIRIGTAIFGGRTPTP